MREGAFENQDTAMDYFEQQFAKKGRIESLGGVVEVTDIDPPEKRTDVPVVFAPGWGATPKSAKEVLRVLANGGRRTLSLDHPRTGGEVEKRGDHPVDELRKASSLAAILDKKDISKVDVVAHSEGAINTIIAASLNPSRFRKIVLVAPGGMIGKDKFPKLAGRFSYSAIKEAGRIIIEKKARKPLATVGIEVGKYIAKNPMRALREAVAISASEIHKMLKDLRDQGIGIYVIHGVDDAVFKMDKVQNVAKADQLDGFYSVFGQHNEMYVDPVRYIGLANKALDAPEVKKGSKAREEA